MSLSASWADHKSKKLSFWSAFSLILHNKNELFLDQIVKCDEKWILYDNWNYQLSGWTKKKFQSTSKSQTCSKKGHGHCLVVCYQPDPLRLSEFQQNHYIWEVCWANWWATLKTARPAASINRQKGPNSSLRQCPTARRTTSTSKVERIGLWSFASSAIFTWSLANWLPLL